MVAINSFTPSYLVAQETSTEASKSTSEASKTTLQLIDAFNKKRRDSFLVSADFESNGKNYSGEMIARENAIEISVRDENFNFNFFKIQGGNLTTDKGAPVQEKDMKLLTAFAAQFKEKNPYPEVLMNLVSQISENASNLIDKRGQTDPYKPIVIKAQDLPPDLRQYGDVTIVPSRTRGKGDVTIQSKNFDSNQLPYGLQVSPEGFEYQPLAANYQQHEKLLQFVNQRLIQGDGAPSSKGASKQLGSLPN